MQYNDELTDNGKIGDEDLVNVTAGFSQNKDKKVLVEKDKIAVANSDPSNRRRRIITASESGNVSMTGAPILSSGTDLSGGTGIC